MNNEEKIIKLLTSIDNRLADLQNVAMISQKPKIEARLSGADMQLILNRIKRNNGRNFGEFNGENQPTA